MADAPSDVTQNGLWRPLWATSAQISIAALVAVWGFGQPGSPVSLALPDTTVSWIVVAVMVSLLTWWRATVTASRHHPWTLLTAPVLAVAVVSVVGSHLIPQGVATIAGLAFTVEFVALLGLSWRWSLTRSTGAAAMIAAVLVLIVVGITVDLVAAIDPALPDLLRALSVSMFAAGAVAELGEHQRRRHPIVHTPDQTAIVVTSDGPSDERTPLVMLVLVLVAIVTWRSNEGRR